MSFKHISRERNREIAIQGGAASGQKAREKRFAKWQALGVDPLVGQSIYDAGYNARVAQEHRRKQAEAAKGAPA